MKKFLFLAIVFTFVVTSSFAAEVKVKRMDSSGDSIWVNEKPRVYAVYYSSATADTGQVALIDGQTDGDTLFNVSTPPVKESNYIKLPFDGIGFDTSVFVRFNNVASISVYARDRTP